jgi:hypothetical protein
LGWINLHRGLPHSFFGRGTLFRCGKLWHYLWLAEDWLSRNDSAWLLLWNFRFGCVWLIIHVSHLSSHIFVIIVIEEVFHFVSSHDN